MTVTNTGARSLSHVVLSTLKTKFDPLLDMTLTSNKLGLAGQKTIRYVYWQNDLKCFWMMNIFERSILIIIWLFTKILYEIWISFKFQVVLFQSINRKWYRNWCFYRKKLKYCHHMRNCMPGGSVPQTPGEDSPPPICLQYRCLAGHNMGLWDVLKL